MSENNQTIIHEPFSLTEYTNNNGTLTKGISIDSQGDLKKGKNPTMAHGTAKTVTTCLPELPDYLNSLEVRNSSVD